VRTSGVLRRPRLQHVDERAPATSEHQQRPRARRHSGRAARHNFRKFLTFLFFETRHGFVRLFRFKRQRKTYRYRDIHILLSYGFVPIYATRPEVHTRARRAYTRTSERRREHTARRTQRPPRVPCHTRERHRQPKRGAFGFTARLVSHTHDITVHRRAHRAPHDRSSRLSRPRAVASPYLSRELSRSSRCVSALSRPTPLSVSFSPTAVQALHVLASIHNYTT
jgi:hypothetical protein